MPVGEGSREVENDSQTFHPYRRGNVLGATSKSFQRSLRSLVAGTNGS
jgi:hypothetical protein